MLGDEFTQTRLCYLESPQNPPPNIQLHAFLSVGLFNTIYYKPFQIYIYTHTHTRGTGIYIKFYNFFFG